MGYRLRNLVDLKSCRPGIESSRHNFKVVEGHKVGDNEDCTTQSRIKLFSLL